MNVNIDSLIVQKRLFLADYSSLATLPLVPGRVFYAPQVNHNDTIFTSLFLVFNLFLKVILAKTSTGDLELLAILLSSPHSSTHLITQVTTQAYLKLEGGDNWAEIIKKIMYILIIFKINGLNQKRSTRPPPNLKLGI